jgi:hypothetical protein
MGPTPLEIGGLPVICFSSIDGRHRPAGKCRHLTPCGLLGPAMGLAICGRPGEAVFLFSCDGNWLAFADTWHPTLEEAKRQAEFEYEGVSATWEARS